MDSRRPFSTRHLSALGALLLTLASVGPVSAQDKGATPSGGAVVTRAPMDKESQREFDQRTQRDLYKGVIPGTRDSVQHIERDAQRARAKTGLVTWIGFTPEPARTRVFIQTTPGVQYDQTFGADGASLTLIFQNARPGARNVMRPIDATHYKRDVKQITVKKKGKDTLHVTLSLKAGAQPRVSQEGAFIYVDLPYTAPSDSTPESTSTSRAK